VRTRRRTANTRFPARLPSVEMGLALCFYWSEAQGAVATWRYLDRALQAPILERKKPKSRIKWLFDAEFSRLRSSVLAETAFPTVLPQGCTSEGQEKTTPAPGSCTETSRRVTAVMQPFHGQAGREGHLQIANKAGDSVDRRDS